MGITRKYYRNFIYSFYWMEIYTLRSINSQNNPLIKLDNYLVEMIIDQKAL